jgi:hypothetical protein
VATATSNSKPAWRAEVAEESCSILQEFVDLSRPGSNEVEIRFRVNRRDGRVVSLTDYRGVGTGTAGTTGIWGTLPPRPAAKPCSLSPVAFGLELAGFVGQERADEIVALLGL